MVLFWQILSGSLLIFYYRNGFDSFDRVQYLIYDVNFGWLMRIIHFNGARIFFIFLFLHFFKALFNFRYRLKLTWLTGIIILLILIGEAFIGYVLVWAQIRFWACVVITSLLMVIPFFGIDLINWIWGRFSVLNVTLKFFFFIHFLLPWGIFVIIILHLINLHFRGRTSIFYTHTDLDKISFYPFYWIKDLYNLFFIIILIIFFLINPFKLGDPEIFIEVNTVRSPIHIVPEWYFLFAYAILRAVPNKLLGVCIILLRIIFIVWFVFKNDFKTNLFKKNKYYIFIFIINCLILRWLGHIEAVIPFVNLSKEISLIYFIILKIILKL
jgi:ubiquinol-cytochrome c reductase cytochrome b subunit